MNSMVMRIFFVVFLVIQSLGAQSQGTGWRPARVVEMVVPTSPGGGTDETARVIQSILQGKDGLDMVVLNRGGAGGGIAYAYMNRSEGNGHSLSLSTLNLVTNSITGGHSLNQTDITPIAHLFSEYPVLVVKAGSAILSGKELIQQLTANPAARSFAFSPGLGGALHLATAATIKGGGIDLKKVTVVPYQSAGEVTTAVIGGHIDVGVMNPPVAIVQSAAGRVKMIAIVSPNRLSGPLAAVPTLREQGINGVSASWSVVIGPKGLSEAQISYWERMLEQMTKTEIWKRHLDQNVRENEFMGSNRTQQYYTKQAEELRAIIVDLGLAK
jgi:putative tricarboxylic transport membrane protein